MRLHARQTMGDAPCRVAAASDVRSQSYNNKMMQEKKGGLLYCITGVASQ